MKISVIIPVYNEKNYILEVLKKVNNQKKNFNLEIIVVDDGSSDGTKEILQNSPDLYDKLITYEKNFGKGYALRKGFTESEGEIILIQDADLEYDPNEYNELINPFITKNADVVLGSRFKGDRPERLLLSLIHI